MITKKSNLGRRPETSSFVIERSRYGSEIIGVCQLPETPWTYRNASRRRYRRGGTARKCSPRHAVLPARCGSSAEYCRCVCHRMSFNTCSSGALPAPDFCFIFHPCDYDEPEVLPSDSPSISLKGADGEQSRSLIRKLGSSCGIKRLRISMVRCSNRPARV